MLLTITNTRKPATDLGYLLHKHPDRFQDFEISFGKVHIFYPEANTDRCTVALLMEIDPIRLVRRRRGFARHDPTLEEYINDRPYVASSFLSVAIAHVFGSALAGRSDERPDMVSVPLPLEARIAVLPCRGGEPFLRRLFEPLGYAVSVQSHLLDTTFPEWGDSPYFTVRLQAEMTLRNLLTHLYVLIPVLDDKKHYWVTEDEVEKLLRHGAGWLASHPEREAITERYLKHQRRLTREALARLMEEDRPDPDAVDQAHAQEERDIEARIGLVEQRMRAVMAVLIENGAKRVIDLGCGEGRLMQTMLEEKAFEEIVGMDVSNRALEIAQNRLHLDDQSEKLRKRVRLLHGSVTYRDDRLEGYDAATVVEVIEHLDPSRLTTFERVLFEYAKPRIVAITTPNTEYNVRFSNLPGRTFRHKDHRFEWTREEFQTWASDVASRFGYSVKFAPIGPDDPEVGPPTQMGVFTR